MERVSVEVPAELVGPIRETVLLLYQATAESLHLALRARATGEAELDEVHLHRARLDELDELAGQLRDGEGGRALSGPRDLLHDTLYGALIDARRAAGRDVEPRLARRGRARPRPGGRRRGAGPRRAPARARGVRAGYPEAVGAGTGLGLSPWR